MFALVCARVCVWPCLCLFVYVYTLILVRMYGNLYINCVCLCVREWEIKRKRDRRRERYISVYVRDRERTRESEREWEADGEGKKIKNGCICFYHFHLTDWIPGIWTAFECNLLSEHITDVHERTASCVGGTPTMHAYLVCVDIFHGEFIAEQTRQNCNRGNKICSIFSTWKRNKSLQVSNLILKS